MRHLSLSLTLLLCACGPKDGTDSDTNTGNDTTATGSTDTPTTAGPPTTGDDPPPTSDTGETPTTGDTLCETPAAPIGPPVQINIRNAGATRVFVDQSLSCFPASPFEVIDADTNALKLDLGSFEFTCAEAVGNRCGEDPGCPVAGFVTQIEPGATFVTTWSGGFFAPAQLSEACADQLCGGCWIEQQAPTGAYTVRVASGAELQSCDPECTPCEPDASGLCEAQGTRLGETIVEAVLDYPAQTAIDLVIP